MLPLAPARLEESLGALSTILRRVVARWRAGYRMAQHPLSCEESILGAPAVIWLAKYYLDHSFPR
jgi:hypothetical protein